jgi:hypothetical protein
VGDSSVQRIGFETQRARLQLYRFLRDNLPLLSSVIWTWVRLCAAPYQVTVVGRRGDQTERRVAGILNDLDRRLYSNGLTKQGGLKELLLQFFESLFTDGAACGEIRISPSLTRVDSFVLADMAGIQIETASNGIQVYQLQDDRRIRLNNQTIFFYGLNSNPASLTGRSLLQAIPFVARIEQTLVSDMHRSMRNAGYQRIHVKVTPPERRADESEDDYVNRANSYFDDTVAMMQDFGPDKNPVTWDDVKIEYVGPSAKVSSSNAWYLNHKAMIEDICAGTHLAPFMLGYAYGTTHNWAEFKYELVQRQIQTVQHAAASLLSWIANIELALAGVDVQVEYTFNNTPLMFRADRAAAEKTQLDNVLTRLNNGLISRETALRELERI